MEAGVVVDPFAAADRYRQAADLAARAREQLVDSAFVNRHDVNLAGLARRAGIHESTVRKWVERKADDGGR